MEQKKPIHVPKHLFSRLLYPNPVCLLTTKTPQASNVMTITWVTCLNNNVCCRIQSLSHSGFVYTITK